tara:strand:+ start:39 stop:380 length:342 start_codon:yes stop_codon:yes gene_type:complete
MSIGYIVAKNDEIIKNNKNEIEEYQKKIKKIYINLKTKKNQQNNKNNIIKFEILKFYLTDILNNYNQKYYKLLDLLEYINQLYDKNKKSDVDYVINEINDLKTKIKNLEKLLN